MEEGLNVKRGTFVVRVLYQRNNTWQGEVLWAEHNERRYFRSALELMRLIDSAIEEGETGEEETKEDETGEDETEEDREKMERNTPVPEQ